MDFRLNYNLFQQNVNEEIDVGIESISQDLNFQNNANITDYSKETSILNQLLWTQSHCSIRVIGNIILPSAKFT